jgi:hypothetical protein
MSHFDPNFDHFRNAVGYCNRTTDHESQFNAFKNYVGAGTNSLLRGSFLIQFVCHPNFEPHRKTITFYVYDEETGSFQQSTSTVICGDLTIGFQGANSYKNYKTASGHKKGLFYELNLYTKDGRSNHHTSRVTGSNYTRDDSHDQHHGSTKGRHWLDK